MIMNSAIAGVVKKIMGKKDDNPIVEEDIIIEEDVIVDDNDNSAKGAE